MFVTRTVLAKLFTRYEPVRRVAGTRAVERRLGPFRWFAKTPVLEDTDELVAVEESDCAIDTELLARELAEACNALEAEGFRIVQLIDTIGGNYKYEIQSLDKNRAAGYGYGFSTTAGVIILAERRDADTSGQGEGAVTGS